MRDKKRNRHLLVSPEAHIESQREFHAHFFKNNIEPNTKTLDFGCGTLRGGIPIIQHLLPGRYTGIDIRPLAIREAMNELIDENLSFKEPRVILSFSGLKSVVPEKFHLIWCHSVLFHMDDDTLLTFFQDAQHALLPDGRILATVIPGKSDTIGSWQEFPLISRGVEGYEVLANAADLKMNDLGDLQSHGNTLEVAWRNRLLEFKR